MHVGTTSIALAFDRDGRDVVACEEVFFGLSNTDDLPTGVFSRNFRGAE